MSKILILGTFDGVHRGHAALLARGVQLQQELHAQPTGITFTPHPAQVLGKSVSLLTLPEERRRRMEAAGVCVEEIPFDRAFAAMRPEEYLAFLKQTQDPAALVIGANHTFGAQGSGSAKDLVAFAHRNGIRVFVEPAVTFAGEPISSTRIRQALLQGDILSANEMLGYSYTVRGSVVNGHAVGRKIGFPTANLQTDPQKALPGRGVYVTVASVDGSKYCAITNIGLRPTVHDGGGQSVESFLLNFSGDLYRKTISLRFLHRLRDEQTFPSLEALQQQLAQDAAIARAYVKTLPERGIL